MGDGNGNGNGSGGAVLDEARVRAIVREELARLFTGDLNSGQLRDLRILGGSGKGLDDGDALVTLLARVGEASFAELRQAPASVALFTGIERRARAREHEEQAAGLRAGAEAADREAAEARKRRDIPPDMGERLAREAEERARLNREQADSLSRMASSLMQGAI